MATIKGSGRLATFGTVLLAFFCLLCALPAAAQPVPRETPVVVGGDRDYPPYEFVDSSGRPAGYNVELTRAIAEVMGMKVEFRFGGWAEAVSSLRRGEIDILQGMSWSDARAKQFDFSPPHTIVSHAIFARRDSPSVASLDQLRGKKVIVHGGGIMHETLAARGYGGDLVLTATPAEGLRLLASGEGDYAVVAILPGMFIIRENRLTNLVPVARSIAAHRYGYAVRKGDAELLARFSEGLAILKKTGRYDEIYNKWLGVLEPAPLTWGVVLRYAALVLVPLLLVLGGTVLWTRSLRRQVAQRTASLSTALEELRLNQQQLIQADKMAALGVLVSGVAHEINNPNGLILLNLQILKKAQADAQLILDEVLDERGDFDLGGIPYSRMREEIPRLLGEMQEGAGRIKRIVSDLKDFARRDDAGEKGLFDFNATVQTATRLLDPTIRKATRRFTADYGSGVPQLFGSAHRIEQVVVNLVLNACQAVPDPEGAVVVETFFDAKAGEVVLRVRDEGSGIAPEHLSRLTDPFFTTKRESGGTGLGLSVSSGIIKEHGGTLTFDSVPGEGTTVTLTFPAAREENPP